MLYALHVMMGTIVNSIWKIIDDYDVEDEVFQDKAKVGTNHFENLFKEDKNL